MEEFNDIFKKKSQWDVKDMVYYDKLSHTIDDLVWSVKDYGYNAMEYADSYYSITKKYDGVSFPITEELFDKLSDGSNESITTLKNYFPEEYVKKFTLSKMDFNEDGIYCYVGAVLDVSYCKEHLSATQDYFWTVN